MVVEIRRQFKEIPAPRRERRRKPDSQTCVDISTKAALREMVGPGCCGHRPGYHRIGLGTAALGGMPQVLSLRGF